MLRISLAYNTTSTEALNVLTQLLLLDLQIKFESIINRNSRLQKPTELDQSFHTITQLQPKINTAVLHPASYPRNLTLSLNSLQTPHHPHIKIFKDGSKIDNHVEAVFAAYSIDNQTLKEHKFKLAGRTAILEPLKWLQTNNKDKLRTNIYTDSQSLIHSLLQFGTTNYLTQKILALSQN